MTATTCREIVRGALRKLGVLSSGKEPTAQQALDALSSLSSLYQEWIVGGAFGPLYDFTTDADMVAKPNMRVLRTTDSPAPVITLPTLTSDGWEPDGDPCIYDYGFIRCDPWLLDMAVITIANTYDAEVESHIYDASTAAWIGLNDLELSDPAPMASRGQDGLSCLLAVRLQPEYNDRPANPIVIRGANLFSSSVMNRAGSFRPPVYGTYS